MYKTIKLHHCAFALLLPITSCNKNRASNSDSTTRIPSHDVSISRAINNRKNFNLKPILPYCKSVDLYNLHIFLNPERTPNGIKVYYGNPIPFPILIESGLRSQYTIEDSNEMFGVMRFPFNEKYYGVVLGSAGGHAETYRYELYLIDNITGECASGAFLATECCEGGDCQIYESFITKINPNDSWSIITKHLGIYSEGTEQDPSRRYVSNIQLLTYKNGKFELQNDQAEKYQNAFKLHKHESEYQMGLKYQNGSAHHSNSLISH